MQRITLTALLSFAFVATTANAASDVIAMPITEISASSDLRFNEEGAAVVSEAVGWISEVISAQAVITEINELIATGKDADALRAIDTLIAELKVFQKRGENSEVKLQQYIEGTLSEHILEKRKTSDDSYKQSMEAAMKLLSKLENKSTDKQDITLTPVDSWSNNELLSDEIQIVENELLTALLHSEAVQSANDALDTVTRLKGDIIAMKLVAESKERSIESFKRLFLAQKDIPSIEFGSHDKIVIPELEQMRLTLNKVRTKKNAQPYAVEIAGGSTANVDKTKKINAIKSVMEALTQSKQQVGISDHSQ